MALTFTMSSQIVESTGVKLLVYSDAGMGKTVLTATLPHPILISAESGVLSLKKRNLERLFGVGNQSITYDIPSIVINNVDEFSEAYEWVSRSREANNFQSVAIDSLSEIAEVVLANAKRQVKDPRQAYGELLEKMMFSVRKFRDLKNKHVYMSAKMEPRKDEATGVVSYLPAMPGSKLGPQLPYLFDEVFRLGVNKAPNGESYRFLQTQPDFQYTAKDRSGSLSPVENPHLGYIISKIQSQ